MNTQRFGLSGPWKRSIGTAAIDFVPVPGSYPPAGECTLEYAFAAAWRPAPGERVFLCTDGVLASAEFKMNGQAVGRAGAYAPYRFEIPAGLLQAQNVIQAHVRDIPEKFGPTPGRKFNGGLIRDIWLERRPAAFIEHVSFRAELNADCSAAHCVVTAEVNGSGGSKVEAQLCERASGRIVATATAEIGQPTQFDLPAPRLWSLERPDLYELTVRLTGQAPDEVRETVGVRRIEIRGKDFFLNNQRLILKGVCRHEFTEAHGYSPPPEVVRHELARIKHAGFNYIRLVHSPQAPCVARLAAELGLLVSEEPGTCFHDLADETIIGPALDALRRLVLRDRNCPAVFAWLIYNECNPNTAYAVRAAQLCRECDPERLISMADCSGQHDNIKTMVEAAKLSFYGINVYDYHPGSYSDRLAKYQDRPIVFTEWGGFMGQGNPRVLTALCNNFVQHTQEQAAVRMAGCAFWAWADYEERTRGGLPAPEGFTLEGLVDVQGHPKPDLLALSSMCFEMDHPQPAVRAQIEILAQAPARSGHWETVSLEKLSGDQTHLEREIDQARQPYRDRVPSFERLYAAGIEFSCCRGAHPLLLGPGREEITIPVGKLVRRVAFLGHVALKGGYPAAEVWTCHHGKGAPCPPPGAPASGYEFVFEDGTVEQPLLHGVHILRGNNICRWWTTAPRSPETAPAVQSVLHPAFEVLRFDLWEKEFSPPRRLKNVRWQLRDRDSIQALLAFSIEL